MTNRNVMRTCGVLALFCCLASAPQLLAGEFRPLFNGKDTTGWKIVTKNDADPSPMLSVKDGVLQVSGTPLGYFHTEKSYKNYVIRYTWRFPKEQPEKTTMNSGCLLHIQLPHKVFPKCVEPQCRYKDHGKLFFIGLDRKKCEHKFDAAAHAKALKPAHEWNTTVVTANPDGTLVVKVNGHVVDTGKTPLTEGLIGFQSEGAAIHFKAIELAPLESKKEKGKRKK